jgi:hypothetical protein
MYLVNLIMEIFVSIGHAVKMYESGCGKPNWELSGQGG